MLQCYDAETGGLRQTGLLPGDKPVNGLYEAPALVAECVTPAWDMPLHDNARSFIRSAGPGGKPMLRPGPKTFAALLVSCGIAFAAAPMAGAHHSVAGQFDVHRTVTLSGVVSVVHWVNPHIYIEFDARQPTDKAATWRLEGVPVGMARKAGLSMSILKGNGETVTIVAHPARDGTPHLGYIIKIIYPDGKVFQFAADADGKAAN